MYNPAIIDSFLDHLAKGPSSLFAILFFISAVLHTWQSSKYNSWPFTWQAPIACILIAVGFICREITAFNHKPTDLASVVQGVFYTATFIFTLPLYSFLFQLFTITPPHRVLTRIGDYTPYIFILVACFTSAIITLISQGCATYFSTNQTQAAMRSGLTLIKTSLIMQLFFNALFTYLLALSQYRRRQQQSLRLLHQSPPPTQPNPAYSISLDRQQLQQQQQQNHLPTVVGVLQTLIALILTHTIYRTVQIFVAPTSPLWTSEAYFWGFEGVIILLYTGVFHAMHPGKYLCLPGKRGFCGGRCSGGSEG